MHDQRQLEEINDRDWTLSLTIHASLTTSDLVCVRTCTGKRVSLFLLSKYQRGVRAGRDNKRQEIGERNYPINFKLN